MFNLRERYKEVLPNSRANYTRDAATPVFGTPIDISHIVKGDEVEYIRLDSPKIKNGVVASTRNGKFGKFLILRPTFGYGKLWNVYPNKLKSIKVVNKKEYSSQTPVEATIQARDAAPDHTPHAPEISPINMIQPGKDTNYYNIGSETAEMQVRLANLEKNMESMGKKLSKIIKCLVELANNKDIGAISEIISNSIMGHREEDIA